MYICILQCTQRLELIILLLYTTPPDRDWVDIPRAHHPCTTCAFVYRRKLIKLRKTSRITGAEKLLTTNNKTNRRRWRRLAVSENTFIIFAVVSVTFLLDIISERFSTRWSIAYSSSDLIIQYWSHLHTRILWWNKLRFMVIN